MTDTPTSAAPRLRPTRRSWIILALTVVLGLVADLGSKHAAFAYIADQPVTITSQEVLEARADGLPLSSLLPRHQPVRVIAGVLEFTLVLNPGAIFGSGAGKRWFFVVFTVVAIGFALWMFRSWTTARDTGAHIAIGLLVAGGIGNLYDRIRFACVRDFIHPLPGVELPNGWTMPGGGREVWPYVSNVADLLLIIGIGWLVLFTWRTGGPDAKQPRTPTEPATTS